MHLSGLGFDHKERHNEEKAPIWHPFDVPYLRRRIEAAMVHQPSLRDVWSEFLRLQAQRSRATRSPQCKDHSNQHPYYLADTFATSVPA